MTYSSCAAEPPSITTEPPLITDREPSSCQQPKEETREMEVYMRRMATCLAPEFADGVVINMVVGGEVATLKSIEEAINLIIAEMPIQVSSLFRLSFENLVVW
ncbi:ATP-dependent RNA helicase FAL1 [Bienertia sinuspersici]